MAHRTSEAGRPSLQWMQAPGRPASRTWPLSSKLPTLTRHSGLDEVPVESQTWPEALSNVAFACFRCLRFGCFKPVYGMQTLWPKSTRLQ